MMEGGRPLHLSQPGTSRLLCPQLWQLTDPLDPQEQTPRSVRTPLLGTTSYGCHRSSRRLGLLVPHPPQPQRPPPGNRASNFRCGLARLSGRGRMCTPHTPPRPPLTPRLLPAAPAPLAPALPGCDGADIRGKGSPSCGPVRGFEAPGRQAWSPQVEAPAADSSVPRAARRPRPGAASPRTPALRFASPHSPLRPGRFPARAPAPRQGPRLGPGARRRTRLTCASARRQVPLPRRGIQVTPPERIPARRQRFGPCRSRRSAGHPPRPRVHPSPPRARLVSPARTGRGAPQRACVTPPERAACRVPRLGIEPRKSPQELDHPT